MIERAASAEPGLAVQAADTLRQQGWSAVMINSNPETVSTDYDTSDLLFFEPLTLEDVLNVVERLGGTASLVQGLIVLGHDLLDPRYLGPAGDELAIREPTLVKVDAGRPLAEVDAEIAALCRSRLGAPA